MVSHSYAIDRTDAGYYQLSPSRRFWGVSSALLPFEACQQPVALQGFEVGRIHMSLSFMRRLRRLDWKFLAAASCLILFVFALLIIGR
jgi:hypothetical protein